VVLTAGALAWSERESLGQWSIFLLLLIAGYFVHPYALKLPYFLYRHFFYQAHTYLPNPEHLSLAWLDFSLSQSGFYAWSWLILTLLAGYALVIKKYRRGWINLSMLLGLTLLSINRPRVIPFALLYCLPILATLVADLFSSRSRRILGLALVLGLWGLEWGLDQKPRGLRLNTPLYPGSSVSFIQIHRPLGNLLHMPKWGDYLLGAIPQYKVFFDAREMQFDKIQYAAHHMYNSPILMNELIQRYGIRSVLLASDFFLTPMRPGDPPWSRRAAFFPAAEWSVVSYDENAWLLIRRIPEHQQLIEKYEFRYLLPDTPIERTAESEPRLRQELQRCHRENPEWNFCRQVEQLLR
jgi:hypothetical protein